MHHSLTLALHRIRDTRTSDAFVTPIHLSNSQFLPSRGAFCARVLHGNDLALLRNVVKTKIQVVV